MFSSLLKSQNFKSQILKVQIKQNRITPFSKSPVSASSLRRGIHFRGTPPIKELSHKETAGITDAHGGIVVEDFVVHSPARSHVRDFKSEATKRDQSYLMPHAVYSEKEVLDLKVDVHYTPKNFRDRSALASINFVRRTFDYFTGYKPGSMTAPKYLQRIVFLETVAAVPGFVAAMIRHLQSLRLMRRDGGFIHTLLEEAENERMHLLTFLALHKPGFITRTFVLLAQGVAVNAFFLAYLIEPRWCHRFVGFLEEEACHTYTNCLKDIDEGRIPEWKTMPAPEIAIKYWRLDKNATVRDVVLAVRADEAIHRDVNHVYASLKEGERNPFE